VKDSTGQNLCAEVLGAGSARLSKRRGTKKGDVKNAALHHFVYSLLRCVAEFGGTLALDKNKYFYDSGGPLADALTSLRPYVPERVIPDGKLDLSTLQRIKAEQKRITAEVARLENDPELMSAALLRATSADTKVDDPLHEPLSDPVTRINRSR
jgi:hypothetical protein